MKILEKIYELKKHKGVLFFMSIGWAICVFLIIFLSSGYNIDVKNPEKLDDCPCCGGFCQVYKCDFNNRYEINSSQCEATLALLEKSIKEKAIKSTNLNFSYLNATKQPISTEYKRLKEVKIGDKIVGYEDIKDNMSYGLEQAFK